VRIGMILDNEFYEDTRVKNEARALEKAGFEVYILCFNHTNYNLIEQYENINVIRFNLNKKLKDKLRPLMSTIPIYKFIWRKKIITFIQRHNIDVLHIHDLYMAGPALLANSIFNLPLVIDLHENYPAAVRSYNWANSLLGKIFVCPNRWKRLEKSYITQVDKVIVLSENFKNILIKKYGFLKKDNIIIYPNVPNVSELFAYKTDEKILDKKNSFIIFYFGAIAKRRGIFACFEALKILKKDVKNIKLLLIGPVDKADNSLFENYLNDPQIKDNIIFYPWKDIKFLPSYIKMSDVCVSPIVKNEQHESGIANKVFQYMLFERPVVVSNCIPQQKIIEEENCGLVYESNNDEDLAEKIIHLYENPDLRKQMGKNGRQAVLKKYNWENASKNLIKLYQTIENSIKLG